ncbi:MAG TPA: N-acetylmuramoyl-L-alanine amidase [Beijerinckiaceae bacterium]|jgi:N-acetylmuramoyl-L-alanine amidase
MSFARLRNLAFAYVALGLLPAALALSAPALSAPQDQAPLAVAAEVKAEGPRTRLTFTLSEPVEARPFVLERPDRVVVELPRVNFQLPPEAGRRREGLVASFRYGLFAAGRSRVVIDLAQPALVTRVEAATRASDGAALLTVELTRTDRETFRRAARPEAPAALAAAAADPEATGSVASADKRPLVVLDAGHGGIDPGAVASTGAFEKDIVFSFVERLRERLEATGRYRVLMTRDHDVFVPLDERVRMARAAKADLFISIHADSISSAPHIRGGTVYTGAERATDTESQNLAERENKADEVAGLVPRDTANDVADILQELTLRETRGFSHRFAKRLLGKLDPVMTLSKKPHREAGFVVLRAPDVPSVLVELGYLSSKRDIDLLTSDAWRDRSAAAMTVAIDQYFGTRVASQGAESQGTAPVSP